jgi:hypothetical protein
LPQITQIYLKNYQIITGCIILVWNYHAQLLCKFSWQTLIAAMLIKHLHKFFTVPTANKSSPQMVFWLSLSLTFAVIYSILALKRAFSGEYVVQDDARQHVFWMRRFLDADLFPNDLIANYFQSMHH